MDGEDTPSRGPVGGDQPTPSAHAVLTHTELYVNPRRRRWELGQLTQPVRPESVPATPTHDGAGEQGNSTRRETTLEEEGVYEAEAHDESDADVPIGSDEVMELGTYWDVQRNVIIRSWGESNPTLSARRLNSISELADKALLESHDANRRISEGRYNVGTVYQLFLRDFTRIYLERRALRHSQRGSVTPTPVGTPIRVASPAPAPISPNETSAPGDSAAVPDVKVESDTNIGAAIEQLHELQREDETDEQYARRRHAAERYRTPQAKRTGLAKSARTERDYIREPQPTKQEAPSIKAPSTAPGIMMPPREYRPVVDARNRVPVMDNWNDRVVSQQYRLQQIAEKGWSSIDDQGVVFEDGRIRDVMREVFIASQPLEPVVADPRAAAQLRAAANRERMKTEPLDERTPFISRAHQSPTPPPQNTAYQVPFARATTLPPPSNSGRPTQAVANIVKASSIPERVPSPAPMNIPSGTNRQRSQMPPHRPTEVPMLQGHANNYYMPLPQRHSPVAEGVQMAAEYHRQRMHDRLISMIHERLAVRMVLPDGAKPRRGEAKSVGSYSGSAKFADLEEWLTNLVVHLAVSQFGGTDRDAERVLITSEFLEGDARKWYNRHVVHVNREHKHWTFEQVITGLYDRFIHSSTMQDARSAFFSTRYRAESGVQGFLDALYDHRRNMAHPPDDYTMVDTFLSGLPQTMREQLFEDGLSPEVNTIDDFVAYAKAYEAAAKTAAHYRHHGQANRVAARDSSATAQRRTTSKPAEPASSPRVFVRAGDWKRGSAPKAYIANARSAPGARPFARRDDRRPSATPARPSPLKNEVNPANKPGDSNRQQGENNRRPGPNQQSTGARCFNCDEVGHMAYNCPKPRKNQAFIRAAHTAVPDNLDEDDDDQEPDAPAPEDDTQIQRPESDDASEGSDDIIEVEVFDNEYYARESDTERLVAMTEVMEAEKPRPSTGRYNLTLKKGTLQRPVYTAAEKECLVTYIDVGGHAAWTLWDAGSTTSGATPAFIQVAGIRAQVLQESVTLQLGTTGSRATVKYGAEPHVKVPGFEGVMYMDVANFDRYDVIIGTPFMRANKVVLDFDKNQVVVNGVATPALRVGLEDTDGRLRRHRVLEKRKD
ncbi:hypothetical protein LshimejAT787_1200990 [Lyophyllum shimeji]|uniref:CCHC-type domain-containing protein n=1 Tax=Lyophyllum shimeji TaxID=47721 RepID=A0A9P3PV88_LYOSH|nr:hypothetical protein LshimejAT787_1200990 [Lyophyllum shimeji]